MNQPDLFSEIVEVSPMVVQTKTVDNSKIISTLRKNSESLIAQAEKINTEVSGNWTRRRQSFADSAQRKKSRMLVFARILSRLADDWEKENEAYMIAKGVEKIRSASDIDFVFHNGYPTIGR